MRIPINRDRKGNAVVEFAIGFGLLLTTFSGVYQFGYAFYVYNLMESAVREGARYGSLADYDGGSWGGTVWSSRVKNMVVYGTISPGASDIALAPGLTTSKVTVNPQLDAKGVPTRIKVKIDNFTIPNTLFASYTLNGKPQCQFDYMGRFTVP